MQCAPIEVRSNRHKRRLAARLRIALLLMLLMNCLTFARSAEKEIYPDPEQARVDLSAALKAAATSHKRVILDFGGNWCPDCQVLDIYFHNPANRPILEANYILVHINIGRQDANLALAAHYKIPIKDGVPALAVLSDHGQLLYSQETGEFKRMKTMESGSVTSFLVQWKPTKPGCSAVQLTC